MAIEICLLTRSGSSDPPELGNIVDTWNIISEPLYSVYTDFKPVVFSRNDVSRIFRLRFRRERNKILTANVQLSHDRDNNFH